MVVLTGDIHSSFVMNVTRDALQPESQTIATEFIGTSISSGGDGSDRWAQLANYETTVPNMKWHSARRGYVRCELTPDRWTTDYRIVPYVRRPGAPVETVATFAVQRGRPGAWGTGYAVRGLTFALSPSCTSDWVRPSNCLVCATELPSLLSVSA
jgi:alkaline phosphatase D